MSLPVLTSAQSISLEGSCEHIRSEIPSLCLRHGAKAHALSDDGLAGAEAGGPLAIQPLDIQIVEAATMRTSS
jgi:hypothetical protein